MIPESLKDLESCVEVVTHLWLLAILMQNFSLDVWHHIADIEVLYPELDLLLHGDVLFVGEPDGGVEDSVDDGSDLVLRDVLHHAGQYGAQFGTEDVEVRVDDQVHDGVVRTKTGCVAQHLDVLDAQQYPIEAGIVESHLGADEELVERVLEVGHAIRTHRQVHVRGDASHT